MFVISGPSGVGKGTVVKRVLQLAPALRLSVSCTTRASRPGEIEGREYHFLSGHEFDRLIEEGAFLEWADIHGHRSGTLWGPVLQDLEQGDDVLLEIDVQGARTVKEQMPDAVLIFLQPPTMGELARRLRSRRTESEQAIAQRLAVADQEMSARSWFDHVVVNESVDRAASDVAAIIAGESGTPGEAAR